MSGARAPDLPECADVVIVGAGLAGAATARALAAQGVRPLLLERAERPGTEASGRSAGMIREQVDDRALRELASAGAAAHRTGGLAGFRATGSFLIGLGTEDVSRHVPWARGRGAHWPGDGVVDVAELHAALLATQDVRCGVTVQAVEDRDDRLAVVTDHGTVLARVVVNAAGAWAGPLGELPLGPRRRHVFRSPGRPGDCVPFVWDVGEGFYFRPDGDGLLLCACDEEPSLPGDNSVQPDAEATLRAKARRLQPPLAEVELAEGWAGQRTFAPDGRFVVGWDPRRRGVFWVAGLGGHGVTVAPAIGRLAADLIRQGQPTRTGRGPLDPGRLLA